MTSPRDPPFTLIVALIVAVLLALRLLPDLTRRDGDE